MTEDAVRWQPPSQPLRVNGLTFRDLKFEGDPGQPASADELVRQARALGRAVTNPKYAECFRLVAPSATLPKGVVQASPPLVQSIRVARRAAPDGRILFDLVGEVTQACTVDRDGQLFDVHGGCTVVIDPDGQVRYSIFKKLDSQNRQARQLAAMRGPLKRFWKKTGRRFELLPHVLRRLHGA
jgi:hypothetical protein